jgi:ribose/xylose/arabinose/galactoside ABC-type transport system permease subunit
LLKKIHIQTIMPLVLLLVLFVVLSSLSASFLSISTMMNLMQQVSAVGTVAIGGMMVIITGGIDFSAGYGLAMTGMAAAWVFTHSVFQGSVMAMLVTFPLVGALIGLANGLLVAKLKILPFVATLAMMSITQGLTMFINGGTMMMIRNPRLLMIGQGRIADFLPVSFLVYLGVCAAAAFILRRTKLGVYNYAMGSNEQALWYAGINVQAYKILVYVTAGICTGIASLLTVTQIAMATPNIAGSILTDSIAASCIGGASLRGGRGSVFGTFMGAMIIVLIGTALTYLRVPAEMRGVFKGAVILLAVALDAVVNLRYDK